MAVDTKELIAEAVKRLLMQKKVKKLTVKDIVDECSITRQTFYYHFEDIPDLLKWVLERGTDKMVEETLTQGNAEKGLRCLFLLALNARPYVEHGFKPTTGMRLSGWWRNNFSHFSCGWWKNAACTLNAAMRT